MTGPSRYGVFAPIPSATSPCTERRVAVGAILALLLGAVAVLGAQRTDPPVVGAGQGDFAGLVDIGGGQRW